MSTARVIILLGGVTLVLPLFLFMVAVGTNPNAGGNIISTIFGGIVFTIFVIGVVFEIKDMVDRT